MVISEIMTKNPVTASADSTVGQVLATLFELDVRHLPIVDGRRLVGIVSDRDVRGFTELEVDVERADERATQLLSPITSVMSGDVIALDPETPVLEAVDTMIEQRIGAVPVVVQHSQELAGIVSYVDVLRAVRSLL